MWSDSRQVTLKRGWFHAIEMFFSLVPSWSHCLCQTAGSKTSSWLTCTQSYKWSKKHCRNTRTWLKPASLKVLISSPRLLLPTTISEVSFFHLLRDVSSSEERRGVKTALVLVLISDIDQALAMFNELRDRDPYRIDNMDTFSNLLYVKVSLLFKPYNVHFAFLSLVKGSKSKSQKIKILIFCWVLEYEARVELLGPQPGGDW